MTKPKMRLGNPLGDSKISRREEAHWREAHFFADEIKKRIGPLVDYLEGKGGGPDSWTILNNAVRLNDALNSAIAMRQGRSIERETK